MLPEIDVARVRRWVAARNEDVPYEARDRVRYELDVADRHLTVVECRPPWRADFGPEWTPIVRLHYARTRRAWAIYWRDRNQQFHRLDPVPASGHIEELMCAVDEDRTGVFWG
jgi:Protein of unknown function (DUF3024)